MPKWKMSPKREFRKDGSITFDGGRPLRLVVGVMGFGGRVARALRDHERNPGSDLDGAHLIKKLLLSDQIFYTPTHARTHA